MKNKEIPVDSDSSGLGSSNADDDNARQPTQTQSIPIDNSSILAADRSQIEESYRILEIPIGSQRPSSPRTSDNRPPVSAASASPRTRRLSAPPALRKSTPASAEYRPLEHINNLLTHAKIIMHLGTQFLYYVLRDTEDTATFDFDKLRTRLDADVKATSATRSEILLLQLMKNTAVRAIFKEPHTETGVVTTQSGDTQANSTSSLQSRMKVRHVQITLNSFFSREGQLSIPSACLKKINNCTSIEHFFQQNAAMINVENSGVFSILQKNLPVLKCFVEIHALLQQIANAFLVCDEARELMGRGGETLFTQSECHPEFIVLMNTLEQLCGTLIHSQQRLFLLTDKTMQEIIREQTQNDPKNQGWVANFKRITELNQPLRQAIESCIGEIKSTQVAATNWQSTALTERSSELTISLSRVIKRLTPQSNNLISTLKPSMGEQVEADLTGIAHSQQSSSPRQSPPTRALIKARLVKTVSGKSSPRFVPESAPPIPAAFRNPNTPAAVISLERKSAQADLEASQVALMQEREKFFSQKIAFHGDSIPQEKTLCRLLTDADVAIVKDCLRLTPLEKTLNLGKNDIRGPGATWLCQFLLTYSPLEVLDMSENLQLFALLPDSREKGTETLSTCAGAVAFAELVAKHPALKSLFLIKCDLNTNSATVLFGGLSQNKTLEALYLGSNDLGDDGVIALCSALTNHPTLHTLSLARNTLETCGPALVELLKNSRIICLDIYANYFSDEAFDQISDQLVLNQAKYGNVSSNATTSTPL